jgi:hypothetical protein
VHELRLRSIAYGTEQTAFYYESVELFPALKFWLQLHACTNVTQEGPYVTFKQVRAATLIESRVIVGNYLLIVASGPLKGTVQPGDADDVSRLYWVVDQPTFTGHTVDDPEQLLLQATDEMTHRLLRRLITAEGLLTRSGHEVWCAPSSPMVDSCSCGYHELVAAWCDVSGSDHEQFGLRWERTWTLALQPAVKLSETLVSSDSFDESVEVPAFDEV